MLVILDTSVFFCALISDRGAPHTIYQAWENKRFELVTSLEQLEELRQVSRYERIKSVVSVHRIGTMINNLCDAIVLEALPPLPDNIQIHDQNDAFLLSMALVSGADYLVTVDRRAGLLQLGNLGRTSILTPTEFCARTHLV